MAQTPSETTTGTFAMPDSARRRTVLVAGGAGGMGFATAKRLAGRGDRIIIADLPGPRLDEAGSALARMGADHLLASLDAREVSACRDVVAAAAEWGDGLDILVNAAGVWLEGPSAEVSESDWDRVLSVNLKGAFFLISAAIPHLACKRGVVINIASDAGLVGNKGAAVYCASKGGLVLLTKSLALELAPLGVRVNAVCPADVATPMLEFQAERYGGGDPRGYVRQLLARYPQGEAARFIDADEIARFIEYLCETAAAPITGAAIAIDFGLNAGY
jgi:NAD(P)-dependent dehydrogenase (short-subunit alcohol dehydrogenase family)